MKRVLLSVLAMGFLAVAGCPRPDDDDDRDDDDSEQNGSPFGDPGDQEEDEVDLSGMWEVEFVDADYCWVDLDLDQDGDELSGRADVDCTLYVEVEGEWYAVDIIADREPIEGEFDGEDLEIEVVWYDDYYDFTFELTMEGSYDGEEIEGTGDLSGADLGDFEGWRD